MRNDYEKLKNEEEEEEEKEERDETRRDEMRSGRVWKQSEP